MDLKALSVSAEKNKQLYQYNYPDPNVLETFATPKAVKEGLIIRIDCPEFTSLCPVTGQPDFGALEIEYEPNELCVESKSLKLFLMGFRNFGCFHEAVISTIGNTLINLLHPKYLEVSGKFHPRGGIAIHPKVIYYHQDSNGEGKTCS